MSSVTVQQVQGRKGQSYVGTSKKGNATSSRGNNIGGHARESGQILDKEQLAFLEDLGIPDGQAAQTTIPNNAAFQTEDLDAYDSDCDDVSNAKAVLMSNLSNYGSDVLLERIRPTLYDGSVISSQHAVIPVIDDEETLILEELSLCRLPSTLAYALEVSRTPHNFISLAPDWYPLYLPPSNHSSAIGYLPPASERLSVRYYNL
ncbi:hypothetical protein Tco_1009298 [Tanacetum coccineum]